VSGSYTVNKSPSSITFAPVGQTGSPPTNPTGWTTTVTNPSGGAITVTTTVVCFNNP
jgi:hypothetical protein